ncbi:glycosyltransferase family 2 protein [Pseudorhizobium pelagicum]|uniref:Glycosyl transferase family A n=1 Tax=Pseudorhizobium pelagicum TaxID=1509405 RepID=A0A922P2V3_9HYPH|nr:glycosyltransferase family 2 protein [Pseudorhizobium pelagicum]KEQ04476.1 glycosyl transferase family A [Pseudorhizobium pelagicum]KEQ06636.1 glycosyl transferase family A [Pseudorhizobium pelagicum]
MTADVITPSTSIDIGICTFRRAELEETLSSLFAMTVPTGVRVRLIVADNDHRPTARALVEALSRMSPYPIAYVHCPQANISLARNGCLDACEADYLAFIDDDERATTTWLAALYERIAATGADAVLGPVEAIYDGSAPDWMRCGDFHSTRPVWVAGDIRTGYTCNVLLDMRSPHVAGRRFDLALGQSGGEDTQFFAAMTGAGGRIAYAPAALVTEAVPAGRASLAWLIKRRFRSGQTHGRIVAGQGSTAGRLRQAGLALAKIGFCSLACAGLVVLPVRRNRYLLRACLHAGAVSGILGVREIRQYGLVEAS